MKISEIVKNFDSVIVEGPDKEINHMAYNTADVIDGSLFFCIEGIKTDGHIFAQRAVDLGAVAIVVSKNVDIKGEVTRIFVKDTREAMSIMSSNFYNNSSETMDIIGITGTNGKTTSTFMLKSILDNIGRTTGLLGTIYNITGSRIEEAKRTTPESLDLHRIFMDMKNEEVDSCVMEISSHSLELKRVFGVKFKVGIFTNLTQDHLDFHITMENYFMSKMKLFGNCEISVINIDDEYGKEAFNIIKANKITYGIKDRENCDVYAKDIHISEDGTRFILCYREEEVQVKLSMPGMFNVYNALGCAAASIGMNISLTDIKAGLEALERVPGRSEIINTDKGITLVLDYAHSPDGIVNILNTAKEYTKGKLYILFGCGGDRDRTKRSKMGRAAGELADYCIVTSDNPRSEEPSKIIEDIIPGINDTQCPYVIIVDRREAIKYALDNAKKGDVVVIAGKGHETYQVLGDKTIHFDEREIIEELLKGDN